MVFSWRGASLQEDFFTCPTDTKGTDSMMREVIIRYRVDDDSENQLFLARVFERFLEEGVTKIFAKAFTKKAVEELEAKEEIDGLQEPIVFFSEDGEIVRASSKESDGRDTQKGAGEEPILAED